MIYADYDYYVNSYMLGMTGVISKENFPYYANKASAEVRNVIRLDMFDNTSEITEEMKNATCEVAEILCKADGNDVASNTGEGTIIPIGISSEKVGEYSVSFTGNSETERNEYSKKRISDVITKWLGPSGMLFRGVI